MISLDHGYTTEDGEGLGIDIAYEEDPSLRIDFENALDTLTERERSVVLNMMAGITGRELAQKIGVTESRISQIAATARDKLTEALV